MNYKPTYLGEIELSEDTLEHYGVKGMKWGRRKKKGLVTMTPTQRVKNAYERAKFNLKESMKKPTGIHTDRSDRVSGNATNYFLRKSFNSNDQLAGHLDERFYPKEYQDYVLKQLKDTGSYNSGDYKRNAMKNDPRYKKKK